jgi:hypothetical protein
MPRRNPWSEQSSLRQAPAMPSVQRARAQSARPSVAAPETASPGLTIFSFATLPLILATASLSLKLFSVRVQVRCRLPIQGSSRAAERAAHDLMAGFCRRAPVCAVMNDDTYRIAVGLEAYAPVRRQADGLQLTSLRARFRCGRKLPAAIGGRSHYERCGTSEVPRRLAHGVVRAGRMDQPDQSWRTA